MACSHAKTCELFAQFALNPALKVWQMHYCDADHKRCARYGLAARGSPVPLNLLPNGQTVGAPRSSSAYGAAALFNAILKKRIRMVVSLLRTGVDTNLRNSDGMTPLMAAASIGSVEIVKLLLGKGADARAVSAQGETAFAVAQRHGFARVADVLAPYADTPARTQRRAEPMRHRSVAPKSADAPAKRALGFRLKALFQAAK